MTDIELSKLKKLYSGTCNPSNKYYWAVIAGRQLIKTVEGLNNKNNFLQKQVDFYRDGKVKTR